jgi:hypothetical protein
MKGTSRSCSPMAIPPSGNLHVRPSGFSLPSGRQRRRAAWVTFLKQGAFSGKQGRVSIGGRIMPRTFKAGDHVEWNSEAGRVQGIVKEKVVSEITFKGYTVHASEKEPQYLIESEKTGHLAMHKGAALRKIAKGRS